MLFTPFSFSFYSFRCHSLLLYQVAIVSDAPVSGLSDAISVPEFASSACIELGSKEPSLGAFASPISTNASKFFGSSAKCRNLNGWLSNCAFNEKLFRSKFIWC